MASDQNILARWLAPPPELGPDVAPRLNTYPPAPNAFPLGSCTSHASVYFQMDIAIHFPPTLQDGLPIAAWDNLRGLFGSRNRLGIGNRALLPIVDSRIPKLEDWEDFLLLCSKHYERGIIDAWNQGNPDYHAINRVIIEDKVHSALAHVAEARGFSTKYLLHEFEYTKWYTETTYANEYHDALARGGSAVQYLGPADFSQIRLKPPIPLAQYSYYPESRPQ